MRLAFFGTLMALLTLGTLARPLRNWSYRELYDASDLVVIARPVSIRDTREQAILPGIQPDVKVNGVISQLAVQMVFKGDRGKTNIFLHHYRLADPTQPLANGPLLVAFDPTKNQDYLLFLKKEAPDGPYAPVSGRTDPAMISVIRLDAVAH